MDKQHEKHSNPEYNRKLDDVIQILKNFENDDQMTTAAVRWLYIAYA